MRERQPVGLGGRLYTAVDDIGVRQGGKHGPEGHGRGLLADEDMVRSAVPKHQRPFGLPEVHRLPHLHPRPHRAPGPSPPWSNTQR